MVSSSLTIIVRWGLRLSTVRTGYPQLGFVFVVLVVEEFGIGLGGDGGINLLLAGDAAIPPVGMQSFGLIRPAGRGLARDLPLLPRLTNGRIQLCEQGL
jgi:hypothetical protein